MQRLLVLVALITLTSSSQAALLTVPHTIAMNAYLSGETSRRTMVVKPISLEQFFADYGTIGIFEEIKSLAPAQVGYFRLNTVPTAEQAALLLERMGLDLNLEYAYFDPVARNAVMDEPSANEIAPVTRAETPNLETRQNYLEASPIGVGAKLAWNVKGGTGEYVKLVDIEVCWQLDHEDFAPTHYMGANPICSSNAHGTAVWGEIAAKRDNKGVTGIAYGAKFGAHGFIEGEWDDVNDQYISGINTAIQGGMDHLAPGDILVIEQHMVGPDSRKYSAVEYWPHIYEQLKAATDRGIICVEAAGNGGSNFDSPAYGEAFDLTKRDSGCIMVGAGDASSKERLSFSNYGSRLDAFGYGGGVVTTGYGDVFNGGSAQRLYTARFSGTSSATPIVSGVAAVVSSIAKASGRILTPKELRAALRATGVPQGPRTAAQRIGTFPNIPDIAKKLNIPARKRNPERTAI